MENRQLGSVATLFIGVYGCYALITAATKISNDDYISYAPNV